MTVDQFDIDLDNAQTRLWQAVGVVMERHDLDQGDALALLFDQSRIRKWTVIDFARAVVEEAGSAVATPTTEAP